MDLFSKEKVRYTAFAIVKEEEKYRKGGASGKLKQRSIKGGRKGTRWK